MRLAGQCYRHTKGNSITTGILGAYKRQPNRGRPAVSYIDNLKADTNLSVVADIKKLMEYRKLWTKLSNLARAEARRR